MSNAADHYENLLAEHYTWMFGASPRAIAAEQREILERVGITAGGLAVDLGAGSGFQSIALADIGFKRVMAIDTSPKLLAELQATTGALPIEAVQSDMMRLSEHVAAETADVIVCMGDTLPHLPARELVPTLLEAIERALRPNGQLVLTFRDLSVEKHGVDRFFTVRSTPDRIMTCFLEYSPDAVMVHDLIYIRSGDTWNLVKSCYPKLRLATDEVRRELVRAGFEVYVHDNVRGLAVLAARKPPH